jgi:carbon-monoxide dehydrogenase large subunit
LAAEALEAAVADIEFADGAYRIAGTDRVIELVALAAGGALDTTTGLAATRAFPSGAHVAEVEVDPETGAAEVVRYTAVDDCGVVMNHTLLEGQILGGMFQGLGQVLGELCVYDMDGQLVTGSFMDYAMPRAELLTRFSISDSCVPSPNNPLGVKGAGEAGRRVRCRRR